MISLVRVYILVTIFNIDSTNSSQIQNEWLHRMRDNYSFFDVIDTLCTSCVVEENLKDNFKFSSILFLAGSLFKFHSKLCL